jgi:uncharacterized protein involved in response to NO
MRFASHPVWQVGFRPFFALACFAGATLPVLWALSFAGVISAPPGGLAAGIWAIQWHAHEMLFGFGWAVLGGFLLTASKNWVQIRGYHGPALMLLSCAWLFERMGMWFHSAWPRWLFVFSNNLFLVAVVAMLVSTLVRHRKTDSYRDNYVFLLVLPTFLVAKHLLLMPEHFPLGVSMTLGLFRVAFLVMLERTLTPFMKAAFQVEILRNPRLDGLIKGLALLMIVESLLGRTFSAGLALLLSILLIGRFVFWKPHLALRRLEIGIMHLGYCGIVAQLLLHFTQHTFPLTLVGVIPVHVFGLGTMGLIIPAMLVRICKGHTGRTVEFGRGDRAVLWLMMTAFVLRVLAPQIMPARYLLWIELTAAAWCICFATLGFCYIPFLLRPRVDGKVH